MGRNPCCVKEGLNRGTWTAREDKILKDYIAEHGEGRWRNLPKRAGASMLQDTENKSIVMESNNWSSSYGNEVNNPTDLLMDFKVGEFSLSDLLNSDFSDLCGTSSATYSNDDSNVLFPSSSEKPLFFSDEMLQDFWSVQANVASNLNYSFNPFFETGGDWLQDTN
ncbi:hypothetical protein Pint_13474 [Pistacia integerrima]|uniref:Uncharacterized protein n=1 Tax=Pistacia integerrima TaxID=434235 RepID=A0ACC0Y7S1_9ROSI|nr:hypothetical protein Pint_13474 [Pistacia integerrima]